MEMFVVIYIGILLIIAVTDWNTQVIYDRCHIMILALAVLNMYLSAGHGITDKLIGAVIVSVPMFVFAFIIPGAFGGGDIKLMAVSGLLLGTTGIVCAMFWGIFMAALYGVWMLKHRKLKRADHFAFGPFLAFGLAVSALWGDKITAWYAQAF